MQRKTPKLNEKLLFLFNVMNEQKKQRPKFTRPESWRYKRLKTGWRKPKGTDHQIRLKHIGWGKMPDIGYRGPRLVRGLHPTGFREVLIHTPSDLIKINPSTEIVRIGSQVGKKKKLVIINHAKDLNIHVINRRV